VAVLTGEVTKRDLAMVRSILARKSVAPAAR
jgi:hypothetical protein